MKSKRSGRDLPFNKIKCDDSKQAEALISGGLLCQKTGIIFKVEEFRKHFDPTVFQVPGFRAQGTKLRQNRNVLYVVKPIHTKTVQTKKKKSKMCKL